MNKVNNGMLEGIAQLTISKHNKININSRGEQ